MEIIIENIKEIIQDNYFAVEFHPDKEVVFKIYETEIMIIADTKNNFVVIEFDYVEMDIETTTEIIEIAKIIEKNIDLIILGQEFSHF